MSAPAAVYRPRNPQSSEYYRRVEDYYETFVGIYDEHFSRQYGFWRRYVERWCATVITGSTNWIALLHNISSNLRL